MIISIDPKTRVNGLAPRQSCGFPQNKQIELACICSEQTAWPAKLYAKGRAPLNELCTMSVTKLSHAHPPTPNLL